MLTGLMLLVEILSGYAAGRGLDRVLPRSGWERNAARRLDATTRLSLDRRERRALEEWLRAPMFIDAALSATPESAAGAAERLVASLSAALGSDPGSMERAVVLAEAALTDFASLIDDSELTVRFLTSRRVMEQAGLLAQLLEALSPPEPASEAELAGSIRRHGVEELDSLVRADHDRPWVSGAVEVELRRLLNAPSWPTWVRQVVAGLPPPNDEPALEALARAAATLDLDAGYDAAKRAVRTFSVEAERAAGVVAARPRRDDESQEHFQEMRSAVAITRHIARQLDTEASNPAFGRATVVVGSWGSGRTRAVIAAVAAAVQRGHLAVVLGFPSAESLESLVVREARRPLGDVATFDDVNTVLRDGELGRVVVCVDDLHDWTAVRPHVVAEVLKTIRDTSQLHAIHWVLTFDEGHLDRMLAGGDAQAWADFTRQRKPAAVQASPPLLQGWISQDAVNRSERLGLKILERHGSSVDRSALEVLRVAPSAAEHELDVLSNPRHAWLLEDDQTVRIEPGSVHLDAFLDRWWAERVDDLAVDSGDPGDYRELLDRLAGLFGAHGGAMGHLDALRALDQREGGLFAASMVTLDELRDAVERLIAHGLLRLERNDTGGQALLIPRPALAWGRLIARRIAPGYIARSSPRPSPAGPHPSGGADVWLERAGDGDNLAEVVGRALLVEADRAGLAKDRFHRVMAAWYARGGAATTAAWLAATDATMRAKRAILALDAGAPPRPRSVRELFVMVRFAGAVRTVDDIAVAARVRLLQPHFRAVGEAGLGSYLSYVITEMLGRGVSSQNLKGVLRTLGGTEDAGCAEDVAAAAVAATESAFPDDWDGMVHHVYGWLSYWEANREPPERSAGREASARSDANVPFWQHYVSVFCERHAAEQGIASFERLYAIGWYHVVAQAEPADRAKLAGLGVTMAQSANLALARWYRGRRGRPEARDYEQLVSRLSASAEPVDLRIAYRLLRHSEPVGPREVASIGPEFDEAFLRLRAAHEERPLTPDGAFLVERRANRVRAERTDDEA